MPNDTTLLAVLIDADNTSAAWAEPIFDEIASLGEASVRRIYGDFSSPHLKGWQARLASMALVPFHSPANTVGKNSSDISLAIDAMDLLHSGRFDGFVLVSSDSDFTRLASRIREQGLAVYGIGRKSTPEAFRKACKRFIFVENLGNDDSSASSAATPDPAAAPDKATENRGKEPPSNAIPLINRAMDAIDEEGEWFSLGRIGQAITQANPDFDTRTYGCAKLSDLMRKAGRFELRKGTGNLLEARRRD